MLKRVNFSRYRLYFVCQKLADVVRCAYFCFYLLIFGGETPLENLGYWDPGLGIFLMLIRINVYIDYGFTMVRTPSESLDMEIQVRVFLINGLCLNVDYAPRVWIS